MFAIAGQFLAARPAEGFQHQLPVLRLAPLHQSALEGFVVGRFGDKYRLHGPGIQAGVPHAGGQRAGGGVEVLDLLGHMALPIEPLRQAHRILQCAPGVGGDQVRHQELLLAVAAVEPVIFLTELLINLDVGLAHIVQGVGHAVLRGHLELARDVVLDQVGKKLPAGVFHQVVEPNARPDEHLLHLGNLPELAQEEHVVGVVGVQIGAGLRSQAGSVAAHAVFQLLLAGGTAEGGRRPAHVVDVALKAWVPGEGHREAHLLDGGHAPQVIVHGVRLPDIGQLRHPVQLRRGQREGRRVDNQKPVPVPLENPFSGHRIVLLVLHHVGPGIGGFGGGHLRKGGHLHPGIGAYAGVLARHAGAPDIGDLFHRRPGGQPGGNLQGGRLPHAIGEDIRLGVKENGPAHLVLPIVVVGKAAQAGLQPADDNRDAAIRLPDPVGIDDGGPVGPQAGPAAGGVGVVVPALFGGGVVGYHGVDVSRADEHAQPGTAQRGERVRAAPVWLGQNSHPPALRLQNAPNDGRAEGGVVHIGVAGDEQEVIKIPPAEVHILSADGEE